MTFHKYLLDNNSVDGAQESLNSNVFSQDELDQFDGLVLSDPLII